MWLDFIDPNQQIKHAICYVHIQNWIGNHRRKLKGKTAVRAEKRFSERQTSGKDIFYGERLPGTCVNWKRLVM